MVKLLALLTSRCLMLARCCGFCCSAVPSRIVSLTSLLTPSPLLPPQALASLDFHSEKLERRMAGLAPLATT